MNNSLIFGINSVMNILTSHPEQLKKLYLSTQRQDQKLKNIVDVAQVKHIPTEFLARQELDKLAAQGNHQGVIAELGAVKHYTEDDLEIILDKLTRPALLLILDGVQDPHNLGACLRCADAAGVHAVIAPKDRAVGLTPTVRKIASGAAEFVPFIQVTNLARTLRFLREQDIWLFGTDDEASSSLYAVDLTRSCALIVGSEEKGLRRLTRDLCDEILAIPMSGSVSSLNVSVASGICLFEAVRQRIVSIG